MKLDVGLMTLDLPEVADFARHGEALGLGAIWSAKIRHDPFLPLAVAAATTRARWSSPTPRAGMTDDQRRDARPLRG